MRYNITMKDTVHDYYDKMAEEFDMSFSEFVEFSMDVVASYKAANPEWVENAGNRSKLMLDFYMHDENLIKKLGR